MKTYNYDPEEAFNIIVKHWTNWASKTHASKWVVGISGGKDSTVVAALAAKIFGKENVYGVMLPCDGQKDIDDSKQVIRDLGINDLTIDIGDAVTSILNSIENNAVTVSEDTKINLPARIRMSSLYAVAQSIGGTVLNTCNLSEDVVGYATLYGDSAGSYAPIKNLTVTEIIKLGEWLGVADNLIHKTPVDGLQPLTDEQKLGMTYAEIDKAIREYKGDISTLAKLIGKYKANKFKTEIIRIPSPEFDYPNNMLQF